MLTNTFFKSQVDNIIEQNGYLEIHFMGQDKYRNNNLKLV